MDVVQERSARPVFWRVAKNFVPSGVRGILRSGYTYFREYDSWRYRYLRWQASPVRWLSALRLQKLRNSHAGQRCFILGNGPSLNRTKLELLEGEVVFGQNRIYLLEAPPELKLSYYVCCSTAILAQSRAEILALDTPRFLGWHGFDLGYPSHGTRFFHSHTDLRTLQSPIGFSTDAAKGIYPNYSVTNVSLQLAYYMGFQQVVLVGVDHNYEDAAKAQAPELMRVTPGQEGSHFIQDYFKPGEMRYSYSLRHAEAGYHLAREAFKADGREVLDATVGGQLTIFPKVEFETLFKYRK